MLKDSNKFISITNKKSESNVHDFYGHFKCKSDSVFGKSDEYPGINVFFNMQGGVLNVTDGKISFVISYSDKMSGLSSICAISSEKDCVLDIIQNHYFKYFDTSFPRFSISIENDYSANVNIYPSLDSKDCIVYSVITNGDINSILPKECD